MLQLYFIKIWKKNVIISADVRIIFDKQMIFPTQNLYNLLLFLTDDIILSYELLNSVILDSDFSLVFFNFSISQYLCISLGRKDLARVCDVH